jgi:hypothetical protein
MEAANAPVVTPAERAALEAALPEGVSAVLNLIMATLNKFNVAVDNYARGTADPFAVLLSEEDAEDNPSRKLWQALNPRNLLGSPTPIQLVKIGLGNVYAAASLMQDALDRGEGHDAERHERAIRTYLLDAYRYFNGGHVDPDVLTQFGETA